MAREHSYADKLEKAETKLNEYKKAFEQVQEERANAVSWLDDVTLQLVGLSANVRRRTY
jgi:hypothetical protein